jgi:hypothetical protein
MDCGEHRRFQARMDADSPAKAVIFTAVPKSRRLTRPARLPINFIANRKQPSKDSLRSRVRKSATAENPGEVSFRVVFVLMIQRAAFAGQLRRATH